MKLDSPDTPSILLIGTGDVAIRVAHLLALMVPRAKLVIASRSADRAVSYANLVRYSSLGLDQEVQVSGTGLNLRDIDRTSEVVAKCRPSIIFMAASMCAARHIANLPEPTRTELAAAHIGPWLPVHLTLVHDLMRALGTADSRPLVVNAAYPDAVGPVLARAGLAPDVGIGNVANIVPAMKCGISDILEIPVNSMNIRLVAHHFTSHNIRLGLTNLPMALEVRVEGSIREVDHDELAGLLATRLRRPSGAQGQQLTATSAFQVLLGLIGDTPKTLHAPAPSGLAGGYPVTISGANIQIDLPKQLPLEAANRINLEGQYLDGIKSVLPDGTVHFVDENMSAMKKALGYSCSNLALSDVRAAAEDLVGRVQRLNRQGGL